MADPDAEVVVQIAGEDVLAGRLWSHRRRSAESQTFSYTPEYISLQGAYELDPALGLTTGSQHTPAGREIFGAFSDCAPDRWGRRLILRAEQRCVKGEGGAPRSFGEIGYLLGVRDDLRQGALRFRVPGTHDYLAHDDTGVPDLVVLPSLLNAAARLEHDEANETELALLLRGGSSLGGARPKAHVVSESGRLAIAKFPSATVDDWDVMRWEAVALALARNADIAVSESRLHDIDGKAVLIVDRFDRLGQQRVGYVSAMTMLEVSDGEPGSYLEIVDVIERHSPAAPSDLRELWRRMAFSILISNLDDHLRNHGFVRTSSAGWSLSPAFDLNPDPRGGERHLSTALNFDDTEARVDTLMEVSREFRLTQNEALDVLGKATVATARWRTVASRMGLQRADMDQMAPAFEHEQAIAARDRVRV